MHLRKRVAFSSDNKYFACISTDENLLIWETINNVFIDCKFDSSVYNTCSSIHWIPPQLKHDSPKKAKISRKTPTENNLLVVGTVKGDILIYNVVNKNLYLHLVGRHSDAVNDMYFYAETNSFFTCSSDKHVGIWNISSGKLISKWKVDDSPVSSICVIDEKNLLSSSTSILWWDIPKKSVIKKFNGHSAEIFKLLPVNAVSLNSCYFLSAAVSDIKIKAWSLFSNKCETPVASFVLPVQPEDIDVSKTSSKDKSLILSAVTKDGFLHLFQHTLNGNINQPVHPKVSIEINPMSADSSFISTKLSEDSESCIIAFGSSKSNITFKHIKIKELLKKSEVENAISNKSKSPFKLPVVNDSSKSEKNLLVNGIKAPLPSENSPKVKNGESVKSSYRRKLRSSTISPLSVKEMSNSGEKEDAANSHVNPEKDVGLSDPKSSVDALVNAIQTHNDHIIKAILHNGDAEFISASVNILPTSTLKIVIDEINHRLHQKYSPELSKWLKEVLRIHLRYLTQSQDTVESLNEMKKYLDSRSISQTIQKMKALKGILSLMQVSSSDESDSENEDSMELT